MPESCLNRRGDQFDANQFTFPMQCFFLVRETGMAGPKDVRKNQWKKGTQGEKKAKQTRMAKEERVSFF